MRLWGWWGEEEKHSTVDAKLKLGTSRIFAYNKVVIRQNNRLCHCAVL